MAPKRFYPPIDKPSGTAPGRGPFSLSIRAMISTGQREEVLAVRQPRPKAYDSIESRVIRALVDNAMAGRGPGCQVSPGMKANRCRRPRTIGCPRFAATAPTVSGDRAAYDTPISQPAAFAPLPPDRATSKPLPRP